MAGEKYTNIGKARWENANVGVIKWDPENKVGLASVTDETTGTVYEIGGGGGGSSDYTTAKLTVVAETGSVVLSGAFYNTGEFQQDVTSGGASIEETTATLNVILSGDGAMVSIFEASSPTVEVSGLITDLTNGYYLITGDATMTLVSENSQN